MLTKKNCCSKNVLILSEKSAGWNNASWLALDKRNCDAWRIVTLKSYKNSQNFTRLVQVLSSFNSIGQVRNSLPSVINRGLGLIWQTCAFLPDPKHHIIRINKGDNGWLFCQDEFAGSRNAERVNLVFQYYPGYVSIFCEFNSIVCGRVILGYFCFFNGWMQHCDLYPP